MSMTDGAGVWLFGGRCTATDRAQHIFRVKNLAIAMTEFSLPSADAHLLVLARVPVLGQVKSRLAAEIGAPAALAAYRELLAITRAAAAGAGVHGTAWLAGPAAAVAAWAWPELAVCTQPPGDLGRRLAAAFAAAFAAGAGRVAVIGTDCPGLRAAHLTRAFALLADHDLVLGPAADGGYYLLGLRQIQPALFQHKAWGTASVLADTLADARRLGLRVAQLPTLRDVDTAADLAAWRAEMPA